MSFAHLARVLTEVKPLGQLFSAAGYRLFLVGGIVRDQLLDEPLDASSDIDLTTDALPADIKRIVANYAEDMWTQGERFGTIGLRAAGRDFEITTHRAESYSSDSRKPQVSFGDDITVDLSRRDFTVNAMAIELPDGDLVDPYGGADDLPAGLLRTPLSADISFSDDPLRMLRAARFSARFALTPVDEVIESARSLHERVRIVAIERIGVEMQRLLGLDAAVAGLQLLVDTGVLAEVLSYGEPQRVDDVVARLDQALAVVDRLPADWRLRLAAIGVAVFDDADGVLAMCRRLKLSRDDERFITRTTTSALQSATGGSDAPTLRRWAASCDDPASALVLARAVHHDPATIDRFKTALDELHAREDQPMVYLDGAAIMGELGITPGPAVGQAHTFLQECYFENGPFSEAEQLVRLQSWWADRAPNS